ncbi:MAG: hypothetical protein F7B20_04360 [Aeropyrum sp.]|nr:hypothetical protein [Aeropyrum sp.]MCE4615460.1 hypothetical protein [Aeropyrum sp.]
MGIEVKEIRTVHAGKKFEAEVELEYKGRTYTIRVSSLSREPERAEAKEEGGKVVVRLIDKDGEGFASCIIDSSHLEKGCVDCRCLLLPA